MSTMNDLAKRIRRSNKAYFAANIMSDVVMDIVKINAEDIKKILGGTE